jgi:cytidine deaminase
MDHNDDNLIKMAFDVTRTPSRIGKACGNYTGFVGAALVTSRGSIFTGVNLDFYCGIGFCAEHSAVAEMVKAGETRIAKIVAVATSKEGDLIGVLPPCGRCRELIYQVDTANLDTDVIIDQTGQRNSLRQLLPHSWQEVFGSELRRE